MSEIIKFDPPRHIAFKLSDGTNEVIFADTMEMESKIRGEIKLKLKDRDVGRIRRVNVISWKQVEDNESNDQPPIGNYGAP